MLRLFYPYAYEESVFTIDYEKLYSDGFRAILFDIDNTLVPHGADSTPEVDELFRRIHSAGLKTLLLSNNSEERIQRFLANIDSPYIYDAHKPQPEGYLEAVRMLGVLPEQTVVIGDQVFTDVFGANRSGLASILVKYIGYYDGGKIGKRRQLEKMILFCYRHSRYQNRIQCTREDQKMPEKKKKLFCEISPLTYEISLQKGICQRHLKDMTSHEHFAVSKNYDRLPCLITSSRSNMIKTGPGIDPRLQKNKAVNIALSANNINGIIVHPGEVFSFWRTAGKPSKKNGYKDGRVIIGGQLQPGTGGGLCNLANTIHRMVLLSPLKVTEIHHHSDALAPEHGERIPFANGTSVSYNYIDFRFQNTTDQDVQILIWCVKNELFGELRCEHEFPNVYEIVEEDHHFRKEGDKYYRISKIYQVAKDRETGEQLEKTLIWDNHSEVMYDPSLIPQELIRDE